MANEILEAQAKGKMLGGELRELEERAGITKKVEDAQLGPFIPNLEATPTEYELDREDNARRRVRDLYFGVQDVALRKALISKYRECDRLHAQLLSAQLKREYLALEKAKRHLGRLPWAMPAIYAVICVAVGAYFFQLYGAIAGGLVGFFLGQATVAQGRSRATEALRQAQESYDEEVKGQSEVALRPDWFNTTEEHTGDRDEEFDKESVIANYYEMQRRAKEKA